MRCWKPREEDGQQNARSNLKSPFSHQKPIPSDFLHKRRSSLFKQSQENWPLAAPTIRYYDNNIVTHAVSSLSFFRFFKNVSITRCLRHALLLSMNSSNHHWPVHSMTSAVTCSQCDDIQNTDSCQRHVLQVRIAEYSSSWRSLTTFQNFVKCHFAQNSYSTLCVPKHTILGPVRKWWFWKDSFTCFWKRNVESILQFNDLLFLLIFRALFRWIWMISRTIDTFYGSVQSTWVSCEWETLHL